MLSNDHETNEAVVATQPPERQWTGWVAITWEPQQTRMQQWYRNREPVFSTRSIQRGYKEDNWSENSQSRVEAGSNTSTVALLVVGGDEKEPSAWRYNRATLSLGDINTGTLPSRLGESRIWDSKMWSWVPRDSDLRMTALVKTSSNSKRQTLSLVREEVT
jgi:hypothetical protein